MSKLNPNAAAFVPNAGAAVFVPGQKIHTSDSMAKADEENVPPPEPDPSNMAAAEPPVEAPSPAVVVNGVPEPESDACTSTKPQESEGENRESDKDTPPTDEWEQGNEEEDDDECSSEPLVSVVKKKQKLPNEETKERKEFVNVVFIGHVDAGKSTIAGHIMYLTGMVDKRTMDKYKQEAKEKNRESWYLSWALDTNQEERDKGKTVEVGRAYFETDKKHFTILDAPGHKSFVPNMITGASQADMAVLVISARKGEFETGFERGGQTQEHVVLAKTAGIKDLVILVNKMDDPTVGWEKSRYEEIKDKLTPYLKKCGFNPKTDITYIPCSGLTGAFIKETPDDAQCSWYHGPCFIEYIDNMAPCRVMGLADQPVRVLLTDKYNDMGTIALGKVESGTVTKGQNLLLMPNRTPVQVLQMWSDDQDTDEVTPGESIKFKLKGVEEDDILSGFVLCSNDYPVKTGKLFDAQVSILEHKSIICPGYSAVLHIHSAVEEIIVKNLLCLIDRKTGNKVQGCRFVKQDQTCIMRLESSETFCLEAYKDFPQMGRFTLRDEGKTIAIGKVLKVIE